MPDLGARAGARGHPRCHSAEGLVGAVPGIAFGLAFCVSSGLCLVRWSGADHELIELARNNALEIGAGHSFPILLRNCYPVNVLAAIRQMPEVCSIYCATANLVGVNLAETPRERGILGAVDGSALKGVEQEEDIVARNAMLRQFGYKL